MPDGEMSEPDWRRELKRNPAKTDAGDKRDNEKRTDRNDNRRDDQHGDKRTNE